MSIKSLSCAALLLANAIAATLAPASAESWTYRGSLEDGGRPAEGEYAIKVRLYDAATGGRAIGHEITLPNVFVRNGAFAADLDFGTTLADGPPLWMEVQVAAPNDTFVPLGSRQKFDAKAALAGICWDTAGNAAIAGEFLGTTNTQPLELKVNSARAARYEPNATSPNVISGAFTNAVNAGAYGATIAGGGATFSDPNFSGTSQNQVTDSYGTVGGGATNRAGDFGTAFDSPFATVSGGFGNTASGQKSTVGGGEANTANGYDGTVGGGGYNRASGYGSVVAGGISNTAGAFLAIVNGGQQSCAGGVGSWASGYNAKARLGNTTPGGGDGCVGVPSSGTDNGDEGTFVWADRSNESDFVSTGPNQFLLRANGGVAFNTTPIGANADLSVSARATGGDADADVYLKARSGKEADIYLRSADGMLVLNAYQASTDTRIGLGNGTPVAARYLVTGANNAYLGTGGDWANGSSRSYKEAFTPIDSADVLAKVERLSINSWQYKANAAGRHLGPTSEDFHAAFALNGDDDEHISTVDADGVALAAIQGLAARTALENEELRRANAEQQAQIDALTRQIAELAARLEH